MTRMAPNLREFLHDSPAALELLNNELIARHWQAPDLSPRLKSLTRVLKKRAYIHAILMT